MTRSKKFYDYAFILALVPPMYVTDLIAPKQTPTKYLMPVVLLLGLLLSPITAPIFIPLFIAGKICSFFENDDDGPYGSA